MIPGSKEMATHCSTLAWKILWMEKPGGLQSKGLQRVGHDLATNTSTFFTLKVGPGVCLVSFISLGRVVLGAVWKFSFLPLLLPHLRSHCLIQEHRGKTCEGLCRRIKFPLTSCLDCYRQNCCEILSQLHCS